MQQCSTLFIAPPPSQVDESDIRGEHKSQTDEHVHLYIEVAETCQSGPNEFGYDNPMFIMCRPEHGEKSVAAHTSHAERVREEPFVKVGHIHSELADIE